MAPKSSRSQADTDILKLGIDANDANAGIARLIKEFRQYNRGIESISESTINYNRQGKVTGTVIKSINKEGQALTRTFAKTAKGYKLVKTQLKDVETLYQKQKRSVKELETAQRKAYLAKRRRIKRLKRIRDRQRREEAKALKEKLAAIERVRKAERKRAIAAKRSRMSGITRGGIQGRALASVIGRGSSLGGLGGLGSGLSSIAGSSLGTGAGLAGALGAGGLVTAGLSTIAAGFVAAATGVAAFTSAIAAGIPASIQYSRQLAELRSISQDSQLSFTQWATGVEKLSTEFAISRKEIAEGAYQTLSNQIAEGAESFKFLGEAAKLSVVDPSATIVDSVNAISSVINSYSLSAKDAAKISGTWFKVIEQGRLRLGEVANRIGRMTTSASNLGISFEESGAGLALLTQTGLPASEAMTLLINLMNQMVKASPELKKLYRQWGVDNGNAAIAAFGLGGVLQRLSKEIDGNSDSLAALFPELRAFRATAKLAADGGKQYSQILTEVTEGQEALGKAFKDTTASSGFQAQRAITELKNAMSDLSDIALELGVQLGKDIVPTSWRKDFQAWVQETKFGLEQIATLRSGLDNLKASGTLSSKNTLLEQSSERVKDAYASRGKLVNQFVAEVRAANNALYDSEQERRVQLKEFYDAQFKTHESGLKKLTTSLNTRAKKLRKGRSSASINEDNVKFQKEVFTGSQSTRKLLRGILETSFGGEKGLFELLSPSQQHIFRMQQFNELLNKGPFKLSSTPLMDSLLGGSEQQFTLKQFSTYLRDINKATDAKSLRASTTDAVGLLRGEQERIGGILGGFSPKDLKSPYVRREFVKRLRGLAQIQKLIVGLKQKELNKELEIEASNRRKADLLERKAERNKVLNREITSERKRLLKLDPTSFKSRGEAKDAFDTIAGPLLAKADVVDPARGEKLAFLVEEVRNQFASQVQRHFTTKEVDQGLIGLNKSIKDLTENFTDKDRGVLLVFEEWNNKVLDLTANLIALTKIDVSKQFVQDRKRLTAPIAEQELKKQKTLQTKYDAYSRQLEQSFGIRPLYRASGGSIFASKGSDTVPAMLTPGEFVTNQRATAQFYPQLVAMNAGNSPGINASGPISNFGDINVTVNGSRTPEGVARNIGRALRREMRRGL